VTDVDSSSRGEVQPYIRPDSEIVREMRALRGFIDEARSARTLDPLFGYLYDAIERRTPEQVWTEAACGPRCAWCCHTRVSATAPEILFLARNLPTGVTDGIPALARRRREGWDKPLLESLAPCAVLADGLCTAHPSRPIVCRTTMSLDADQCRLACSLPDEAVIPSALASVALRAAYEIALQGALLNAGYCTDRFDLATALADAVSHPDAESAWLAGGDVFPSALRVEQDGYLDEPVRRALYEAAFDPGVSTV
jgi:hypothetical protein